MVRGSFTSGVVVAIQGWDVSNFHVTKNKTHQEGLETTAVADHWVLAGDFNVVHHAWDPGADKPDWDSWALLKLVQDHDGAYVGDGLPTRYESRRVIDLTFSNHGQVYAETAMENLLGSDHRHLWITLPVTPFPNAPGPRPLRPDLLALRKILQGLLLPPRPPPPVRTVSELESSTKLLMALLTSAALAATPPPARPRRKARTDWWNDECEDARDNMRAASGPERREKAKAFSQAVLEAKRSAWKTFLESKGPHWRAAKTLKTGSRGVRTGPGIQRSPEETFREYFQKSFPATPPPVADTLPPPPKTLLPWSTAVSPEEAFWCCTRGKSTTPGNDNLARQALASVWAEIGPWTLSVYRASLALGHYPSAFQDARIVLIPKPNGSGLRPISLTPALAKGLDRIVADRMSLTTIQGKLLSETHLGGLPGRSAVDLVGVFVHDMEPGLGQATGVLTTMDVAGGFDNVDAGRLGKVFTSQGWPPSLVRWAVSFAKAREVVFQEEDRLLVRKVLPRGLPQGSPVSPILFALYIAPALAKPSSAGRFTYVYADDVAVLARATTTEKALERADEAVSSMAKALREAGCPVNPAKTECLLIKRGLGRAGRTFSAVLPTALGPLPIKNKIKWLGVTVTSNLSFAQHAKEMLAKADRRLRTVTGMLALMRPEEAASLFKALVPPVALYGAELWWKGPHGRTVSGRPGNTSGQGKALRGLDALVRRAGRKIFPFHKSAPNAAVHREMQLPPAHLLLEGRRLKWSLRLKLIDDHHPLAVRTRGTPGKSTPGRPVARISKPSQAWVNDALPVGPFPEDIAARASAVKEPPPRFSPRPSKPLAARAHRASLAKGDHTHLVYTDGSKKGHQVGWGAVAFSRDGHCLWERCGSTPGVTIYDAELKAVAEAVTACSDVGPGRARFFSDNQAVVAALKGRAPLSFGALARTLQTTIEGKGWSLE